MDWLVWLAYFFFGGWIIYSIVVKYGWPGVLALVIVAAILLFVKARAG